MRNGRVAIGMVAGVALAFAGCAQAGAVRHRPVRHAPAAPAQPFYPPAPPPPPAGLHGDQFLYGSAEAAAINREVWHALVGYVEDALKRSDRHGVVLARDATLHDPRFVPCEGKPPAIVLDVDETTILNLGAEYDDLEAQRPQFDDDVWVRWERTGVHDIVPTPGAKDALDRLRGEGVTVVFNTNRNAFSAAWTEQALNDAGLGPARHGQTLFLAGDDAGGSAKDGRRLTIAARYCVLAMAGDQLVDFSDRFEIEPLSVQERRADAALPGIAALWGAGWFVMPNPVYGSALQGGADDIFPKNKQWRDPGPTGAVRGKR